MIKYRRILAVIGILIILVGTTNLIAADPEKIKVWIQQLYKPTANAKLQAAARLADAGDLGPLTESALEGLAACLKDPNTDVRVYGAYALGRIGADSERTISLLAPLLGDTNEHVRYSAEWSISEVAKVIASQPISDTTAKNMLGCVHFARRTDGSNPSAGAPYASRATRSDPDSKPMRANCKPIPKWQRQNHRGWLNWLQTKSTRRWNTACSRRSRSTKQTTSQADCS